MNYLRAYFRAWWTLWCWANTILVLPVATFLYVFTHYRLSPAIELYVLWVISLAAVGGMVREWMDKE